ncbi:uncharacterized protein GGS25DRAFT_523603 [Hypoxylon fragiforme]|uniref:uncharacterized protein n=1 Tax=Hypoxylon fragiforme TaxID=63214 RepID=UPI0020C63913|nr:uncharacterized protein GGS25DRAFT_523603 [Hypoxylon fragiforme]KAI2605931.1 hypothetical protein GGS25DRAFT_523603 [Hypoxylon fragiforme]
MKSLVFGNGLLCMAFSAIVDVRIQGLGFLPPLQTQTKTVIAVPPAFAAILATRRRRPYRVNLGPLRPPVKQLDPSAPCHAIWYRMDVANAMVHASSYRRRKDGTK